MVVGARAWDGPRLCRGRAGVVSDVIPAQHGNRLVGHVPVPLDLLVCSDGLMQSVRCLHAADIRVRVGGCPCQHASMVAGLFRVSGFDSRRSLPAGSHPWERQAPLGQVPWLNTAGASLDAQTSADTPAVGKLTSRKWKARFKMLSQRCGSRGLEPAARTCSRS